MGRKRGRESEEPPQSTESLEEENAHKKPRNADSENFNFNDDDGTGLQEGLESNVGLDIFGEGDSKFEGDVAESL